MINFSGIPERSGDWTWFKAYITEKRLAIQYEEDDAAYFIYGYDSPEVVTCKIWKGVVPPSVINAGYSQAQNDADKSDFETNYKTAANQATMRKSADGTLQTAKQEWALGRAPFQRTDNGSEIMNIDGVEAGTPVVIWNGTGAGDPGGDWTLENYGTEETYAAHSGTYGIDTGVRAQDDFTRLNNGANIDIDGTYDSLLFWMMPKAYPPGSKTKLFWEKLDGTNVGSKLRIDNYTSNMDLDVWQQVEIPIEDFDLTEDVAKLACKYVGSAGQQFYLDDFELVSSAGGGPYKFRVAAPTGFIYHVERIALVMSAPDSGWSSTSFANIVGGLGRGLLIRFKKIGEESETYWKVNCKNNSELFGQLQVLNDVSFSSGDRQFVFALEPQLSSVVLVDDDEVVDIVVRDDLSSLGNLRAFLHYGMEVLP